MKRRLVFLGMVLLLVLSVFMVSGWPIKLKNTALPKAESVPNNNSQIIEPAKKAELDSKQEQIMQKIGKIPYITDVLFDQTPDGKMILSAVADIGSSNNSDRKQLARTIAYQFTTAAFQVPIEIAEASIHITQDNQLLLGTSLNNEAQKKMDKSVMTGSGAAEFIQFLKQNQVQSTEAGKSTFFYEAD